MKEPLCKKGTATITINSEPPKPTTFEDLGYVQVVRCKDCKYRPELKMYSDKRGNFTAVKFPEGSKCPCQCEDFFYSWYPSDDWFCANGKPKEENDGEDMARDTIKGEK